MILRAILVALLALPFAGCRGLTVTNPDTGQEEVHWPAVAVELSLLSQDLLDAAAILAVEDPPLANTLAGLATVTATLQTSIEEAVAAGGEVDVLAAADLALSKVDAVWDALEGEPIPAKAQVVILLARSTLRRIRANAGAADPPEEPPGE